MSITKTMIVVAIVVAGIMLVASASWASRDDIPSSFKWELAPVEMPKTPGLVDLKLDLTPTQHCRGCTTVELVVSTMGGLEHLGPETRTVSVEEGVKLTEVFSVNLPPNDTCGIRIQMNANGVEGTGASVYFVTFIDSVEFWKGPPRGRWKPGFSFGDRMRSNMTPEQLKETVTVTFELQGAHLLLIQRVQTLVGEMQTTGSDSVFIAVVTRDVLASLYDLGISTKIIDQPVPSSTDTPPPPGNTVDSLGTQGFLDSQRKLRGDGVFAVAGAYPLTPAGKMPPDENITIYIECLNNTGYNQKGITNGFRVYSPGGATWGSTVGDTLGTLEWKDWFDLIFNIMPFSVTGSGADTIGFGGSRFINAGLPWWFDDAVLNEGDIDGSSFGQSGPQNIDISDLVYIVDYMFTGGPTPPACP